MLEFKYAEALATLLLRENDSLFEVRLHVLQQIYARASAYQKRGMMDKVILAFFEKKVEMIVEARTKGELAEIKKPPHPEFDGNRFRPGSKYDTEEEELLVWSMTSLQAPLKQEAGERYMELFVRILPEEARAIFPKEYQKFAA